MKWFNAHLGVALPQEEYLEIKKHPEIKWGAIARKAILEHLKNMKDYEEFLKSKESKPAEDRK
jgi:hypothetical protein